MDAVIPAAVGLGALALLFLLLAARSWTADVRARRNVVARRLRGAAADSPAGTPST